MQRDERERDVLYLSEPHQHAVVLEVRIAGVGTVAVPQSDEVRPRPQALLYPALAEVAAEGHHYAGAGGQHLAGGIGSSSSSSSSSSPGADESGGGAEGEGTELVLCLLRYVGHWSACEFHVEKGWQSSSFKDQAPRCLIPL